MKNKIRLIYNGHNFKKLYLNEEEIIDFESISSYGDFISPPSVYDYGKEFIEKQKAYKSSDHDYKITFKSDREPIIVKDPIITEEVVEQETVEQELTYETEQIENRFDILDL